MSDNYETELTAEELAEIEEQAKKEAEEAFIEDDFGGDIFDDEDGVYGDSDGEIDDTDLGESSVSGTDSDEEFTESDTVDDFEEESEEEVNKPSEKENNTNNEG